MAEKRLYARISTRVRGREGKEMEGEKREKMGREGIESTLVVVNPL